MSALGQAAAEYLALRRQLGYKLEAHGPLLAQFVAFLDARGETVITTPLALAWATEPAGATPAWWRQRLAVVRGFARHRQAFDARTEVPTIDLLPGKFRRAIPYLYSEAEIQRLMAAAARMFRSPLKAATYETLIGLLSVTGMRVGEAIALDRADVELGAHRLTIRRAKGGRSREIPLHPSTVAALDTYARMRDERQPHPTDPSFLLSTAGTRLRYPNVWNAFDRLRDASGLDRETLGRQARIHDVRHAFVLNTLLGWYRDQEDVEAKLPLLATFLGHVDPASTYWYFEGAPQLLALAAQRLERTWKEPS
ncbi:MAG: tyrosine-type recombinase/integrase [Actinomycetota bacterium]|nr:tyrosine-type recombinase/integrase [Actinomycetota bacterium]